MLGDALNGRVQIPSRGLLEVYWVRLLAADGSVAATSFPDDVPVDGGRRIRGRPLESTATGRRSTSTVRTFGSTRSACRTVRCRSRDRWTRSTACSTTLRQRTLLLVVAVAAGAAATRVADRRNGRRTRQQVDEGRRVGRFIGTLRRRRSRFRHRRGRTPRRRVPRHARCARAVPGRATPTGAGRRPRAEDPADEPEDQSVGACGGTPKWTPRCATVSSTT